MIATVDIDINAANPGMPLKEFAAFTSSPSHLRLRNVPRRVGLWELTRLYVAVTFPDNATRSVEATHNGALWTATVAGCAASGTVRGGFQVIADGVDESGNAVTGYVLGLGDVRIISRDSTVNVDGVTYPLKICEEMPDDPKIGYCYTIDGVLSWYDGTEWIPLGGGSSDMSHAEFAGLPADDLEPDETGIPEICSLLNAVKNLLRPSAPLLMLALCAELSAPAAIVETNKLSNLKGGSNVVTRVDLSGLAKLFRPFGDEYVYEPTGMGDFTYESENAAIVAALGNTQPSAYEDGDYVEYYFDEIYADGRYWWGNAYTTKNSPVVTFRFYSDYWDDETGEYFYDEVEVVGTRQPSGWDRTDPVDTFAHQSELTSINSSITSLRNTLNGETKVLRTGQTGEYGSGWGYVQRMMDSELRKWRIRVPKFGSTTGMTTNSTAATASYRTVDNPVAPSPVQYYTPKVLTAPHTWMPGWGCYRRLAETRGVYGTDAVALADYRIGLLATGTDSYVLDYTVTHTNRSPMCFNVHAVTNGMSRLMVAEDAVLASRRAAYVRYVDYPQLHFRWQTDGNSTYTVTNENWLTLKAVGVYGDAAAASTSNGTIPLSFICVFDAELRSEQRTKSSGAVTVMTASVTNVLTTATVTLSCTSATTLEDVYVPYYRLVTTHGDENNFYYDAAQNRTWRIAVSNGCFYSEWVMDGDWRRRGL